ncbi:MAG TPA: SoxR reducing system RseC family protein [Spirochaetales bacterium]|nr:SoxR reducing system RseC family protein [Spirochaetales bacterium]HRY54028.1 SoxR reducing system RseC family protein [Spirochaetia bacterium]HRZ63408.1 SoxR reducing system RseC family protein [Spirochaetia bacterium]
MTERGVVSEIQDRLLTVQLELNEGCGACSNEGCKKARRGVRAYNRQDIPLAEGDSVDIEIEGKAQLYGALWVLGLPLVLFACGYILGRVVFPDGSETPAALCGIAGLSLGMVVGILVQKKQRLESLPSVIRKVEIEISGEPRPDWAEGSPEYVDAASN